MALDNILDRPTTFQATAPDGEAYGTAATVQHALRELRELRGQATDLLHTASPDLAAADRGRADRSSWLRALDAGQNAQRMPVDELQATIGRQPAPAQEQFRLGALAADKAAVATTPDARDVVPKIWGTKAARDRYAAILPGGPEGDAFRGLQAAMDREAARRDLVQFVTGGSQTADKGAGAAEVAGTLDPALLKGAGALVAGHPLGAAPILARLLAHAQTLRLGQDRGALLADALTSDDPQAVLARLLAPPAAGPGAAPFRLTLGGVARAFGTLAGQDGMGTAPAPTLGSAPVTLAAMPAIAAPAGRRSPPASAAARRRPASATLTAATAGPSPALAAVLGLH
ncbi:hypothetical protein tb265_00210 [Gemmatimonadetes bacterium T265]|nr:hypothetical protein tb265_00210 [Gemmatimonadetes bacterium T265]